MEALSTFKVMSRINSCVKWMQPVNSRDFYRVKNNRQNKAVKFTLH